MALEPLTGLVRGEPPSAPAWARSRRFRPDEVAMLQRKPGHMQRGRKSRRGLALQLRRAGHNVVQATGRHCGAAMQDPEPIPRPAAKRDLHFSGFRGNLIPDRAGGRKPRLRM